jgi:hypothetical protein
MHRADKAAERKDFTAAHGKGEMVSALRQRRPRVPRIGYRIVFVVIRSRGSVHRTADSVQLAVNGKCRNLGTWSW